MSRKCMRLTACVLVLVMGYSPSFVFAQQATAAESKAVGNGKIDVSFVTPHTAAAVVLYPRHVLTAPETEMLPTEVITAVGEAQFGIDPMQIEQVIAVAEPPQNGPPNIAVVLKMASPLREGKILGPLWEQTTEAQFDGKTYRRGVGPMPFAIFRLDDRTLIVATDPFLRGLLANHKNPKEGTMSRILGRVATPPDAMAVLLVEPIRPLIAMPLAMAPVPPQLADAKKIPDLLHSVGAKVNMTGDMAMSFTLKANNEAAAEQLEQIIDKLLAKGKNAVEAEMAKNPVGDDPVEQAGHKYGKRLTNRMIDALRPVRKGQSLVLANDLGKSPQMVQVSTIGIMIALLLPAVQAAREAARRMASTNNVKQILLAMHNYMQTNRAFPARANFDAQGKPLLSWRVHLLPFLGENDLYKQFHLDEPWDSEHNSKLIPAMPAMYQNPSSPLRPGMTDYLAVCGDGLAFDGQKGRTPGEFRDGFASTILVVEANPDRAVTWTKPDDWECDAKDPLVGLRAAHPDGFNVGFADGSVQLISNSIDPKVFHAFLTIAGGETPKPRQ